jgi:hypothetical protein
MRARSCMHVHVCWHMSAQGLCAGDLLQASRLYVHYAIRLANPPVACHVQCCLSWLFPLWACRCRSLLKVMLKRSPQRQPMMTLAPEQRRLPHCLRHGKDRCRGCMPMRCTSQLPHPPHPPPRIRRSPLRRIPRPTTCHMVRTACPKASPNALWQAACGASASATSTRLTRWHPAFSARRAAPGPPAWSRRQWAESSGTQCPWTVSKVA